MNTVSTTPFARFHQRIADKSNDNSLPSVVIVAIGDSVTAGYGYSELMPDDVYHAQLKRLLERQYPKCVFSVINAGFGGETAAGGVTRFERDVPHHKPDLVLIGYGLNDAHGDREGVSAYAEALETLIHRTREATEADLVLLTPNMMPHYASENIPEKWQHATERFLNLQNAGVLAAYASAARETGQKHGVPVADVYAAWEELENQGRDTTAMLSNGLNHPDASGHQITAGIIFELVSGTV